MPVKLLALSNVKDPLRLFLLNLPCQYYQKKLGHT